MANVSLRVLNMGSFSHVIVYFLTHGIQRATQLKAYIWAHMVTQAYRTPSGYSCFHSSLYFVGVAYAHHLIVEVNIRIHTHKLSVLSQLSPVVNSNLKCAQADAHAKTQMASHIYVLHTYTCNTRSWNNCAVASQGGHREMFLVSQNVRHSYSLIAHSSRRWICILTTLWILSRWAGTANLVILLEVCD